MDVAHPGDIGTGIEGPLSAPRAWAMPAGLAVVLLAALAVRLWIVATHSYIVQPDETFQYLEPAHRLVFGAGVVTWEFLDGIRSWFLPGIIAGVMWLTSLATPEPGTYVLVTRLLCVAASLSVPFVGYRFAARRIGPAAGLLTGLLCAFATEAAYFAPTIMTEPLATDAALLAIWFGDGAPSRRRLLLAGVLFGLAASLRYQYAPVLAVAALVQHARRPRDLGLVVLGGIAVVAPVLGVLDDLTWGVPFGSVWQNYLRNAAQGISGAMGTQPWFYYPAYYFVAWGLAAAPLLALAILGAVRAPVLGVVVVGTIALHALTPHKELRFVFLATACVPMLIGLGLGGLLQRIAGQRAPSVGTAVAAAVGIVAAGVMAFATYANATPPDAWHRDRAMLRATAAARDVPGACGLAVRSIWVYRSGGYTYWHRDLPIYFETWEAAQKLDGSDFRLDLKNVLDGHTVTQYPGAALAEHADRFNVIVGTASDGLPGFTRGNCYGAGSKDDPTYCVFTRPGGCA